MTAKPTIRCAIYTRKSSEDGLDQRFNSLDAQYEACAAYIASQRHEGWKQVTERYDDGGISGGTLERPALLRLLADIDAGRVGMVVVYKIDRLTRSLADFAKLVERFEAAGCSFVSVTQAFNTSSSMGRLTLNVLLSFAQFEREVTAERIRDKIAASKKKGLWMGSIVPLGYDRDPNPQVRGLVVNLQEAGQVLWLFECYDRIGTLAAVEAEAREAGLRSKLHHFTTGRTRGGAVLTRGMIHHLLTNPVYRGQIRHHDRIWPGQHPAIVPVDLWDRVQSRLVEQSARPRGRRLATSSALPAPLVGKIIDECGDRLTPSHTTKNGRRISYYVSARLLRAKGQPEGPGRAGWRLPARELHKVIAETVAGHLGACADRQSLLAHPDVTTATRQQEAVRSLAERLRVGDIALLGSVIASVLVAEMRLDLMLDPAVIAESLGVTPDEVLPDLLTLTTPLMLGRRGIELKLVAGDRRSTPDPTFQRVLARSHAWLRDLKAGTTLTEIARADGHSESYIRTRLPLALLSPRIQAAILDGTLAPHLTVDALIRMDLPASWREQEARLGLGA